MTKRIFTVEILDNGFGGVRTVLLPLGAEVVGAEAIVTPMEGGAYQLHGYRWYIRAEEFPAVVGDEQMVIPASKVYLAVDSVSDVTGFEYFHADGNFRFMASVRTALVRIYKTYEGYPGASPSYEVVEEIGDGPAQESMQPSPLQNPRSSGPSIPQPPGSPSVPEPPAPPEEEESGEPQPPE